MIPPYRIVSCEQVTRVLSDYLDGTLPRPQRYFVKLHLLVCPACVAFLKSLQGARRMARTMTETEVPEEVTEMVGKLLQRFKAER
ncbi:MAG TPA: zf-HC2 domain-containing protein [Holophagaceae bacterium]|nr:zf-HC2 domain-containing protein [Holophagaceae bacterium]